MDIHVDVHGDGSRPWLLLVHGFLSSRGQWRPNIEALAIVSTPVTVELLGHGRSATPPDPDAYSVTAYIRRFEALRRSLGAERWFICGQSFGAGLTIRYALEHPDRIIGQVFTNSISGLSPPDRRDPAARRAYADTLEKGGRAALEALPFHPRPSRRLAPEIWRDLVADAALLSPTAVAEAMRTTVPGLSVVEDLTRIAVPTLLVNGAREAAFQPMRDRAARDIPGLEIVDLDGGHAVNLDCPAAFNAAVAAFIAKHWA
jgi:2-succinyl-6-hydroxy-2,4-cyclohexadiene-1-carboxylate synthase